ncbi:MAG TPA: alpha/beta family hydrolase [Thermoanaerobaculia bacterium]
MHLLTDGPESSEDVLVLAHGAGGAMDTPFMNTIARGVGACGIRVVRFEFPYMAARREGGRRGAPDREPVLLESWRAVVSELGGGPSVVMGGKSLGGRMATMVADSVAARGLVCLGYPFHPPGQPTRLRTKHLATLRTPTLIVQGERDPFGNREDVKQYELSPAIRIEWMTDGDHSLKPRVSSGSTEKSNISRAIELVCSFIGGLD